MCASARSTIDCSSSRSSVAPNSVSSNPSPLVVDPRKPPTGNNVKWDKLAVLERPYPQVVAGTPQSWSFDSSTRVFRLTFSTHGPGGPLRSPYSLVYVPTLHYPHGYRVTVTGAKIVGSATTSHLVLRNVRGASDVSVVIQPR